MPAVIPLAVSASAAFVSDGKGGTVARARLGPTIYGTSWRVTRMVTSIDPPVLSPKPKLIVYRNVESATLIVDASNNANQDTDETDLPVYLGVNLLFVWTGGTINSVATIVVTGDVFTGRQI